MNTTQRDPILTLAIVMFIALALAAIVLVALGNGMLWQLIGGIAVFGAVVIALGFVIAKYIAIPLINAKVSANSARYDFLQNMASKGLLPTDGSFEPIHAQIAAPVQQGKINTALQIFDFNPNDIHTASVNYIMFSAALLGENGNRLASAPECRMATNLANYSDRSRDRIVKHLSAQYGVVTQPGPVDNGGGTFVPAEYGTVGKLYHHILLNSGVESLPEAKR